MAAASRSAFESVGARNKRVGRNWLVVIFLLLRIADYGFFIFAWHAENPIQLLKGVVIGSVIWSTVFIAGVWERKAWARYLLITVLVPVIAAFTFGLVILLSDNIPNDNSLLLTVFGSILVYAFCIIPLVKSHAVLRLATAIGGGDR
jgi:hypothetical protein